MAKGTKYRVRGIAEEFDCPNCGCPVWSGDTAWEYEDGCYCSPKCRKALLDEYDRNEAMIDWYEAEAYYQINGFRPRFGDHS